MTVTTARAFGLFLASMLALGWCLSGCAWTLRHIFPDCNNNPCQDVCGCQFCYPGDPPQNGCVPPPAQSAQKRSDAK